MKAIAIFICIHLTWGSTAFATSLKEIYDQAGPGAGYDKYVELETGITYTGGLWMGGTFNRITAKFEQAGVDVRIVGNGAIIDLQGQEICFAYCNNNFDIDDCVIINGDVKFRGYHDDTASLVPGGSVKYVTFYKPHDYGVRTFGSGAGILVERNIVVDAIDTGSDFMYLSGAAHPWLPTGANFSLSLQSGYAFFDNWSFHTDPAINNDPLRHFHVL